MNYSYDKEIRSLRHCSHSRIQSSFLTNKMRKPMKSTHRIRDVNKRKKFLDTIPTHFPKLHPILQTHNFTFDRLYVFRWYKG